MNSSNSLIENLTPIVEYEGDSSIGKKTALGYHLKFRQNLTKISSSQLWKDVKQEWVFTGLIIRVDSDYVPPNSIHLSQIVIDDNSKQILYNHPDRIQHKNEFPSTRCICLHNIIDNCQIKKTNSLD